MKIECVWEHNDNDTLLWAVNSPGAYTRGATKEIAIQKMPAEIRSYLLWKGDAAPDELTVEIVQDAPSKLQISDADTEVLFAKEKTPVAIDEYAGLKALVLKSAADFLSLYNAILNKDISDAPVRKTFYGQVPRTAREIYEHTKNVNGYYFGEIGVDANKEGTIYECRCSGFEALESKPDFLANPVIRGSHDEYWTLRKVLRRFLWHDRIHAKAMYRMAVRIFRTEAIPNVFAFEQPNPH